MNLIPEDWFIRKSTFTGQETFFPKDKILARIEAIRNMKDGSSLDEVADFFSPKTGNLKLMKEDFAKRGIVSRAALDLYIETAAPNEPMVFEDMLCVFLVDKLLGSGDISLDEGKMLVQTMIDGYRNFEGKPCDLYFIRKMGTSICFLAMAPTVMHFDKGTKVTATLQVTACAEELRIKLSQEGI
jgi:hypothetical protein